MRQRRRLLSSVMIALSALVLLAPTLAHAVSEASQVRAQLSGTRLPFIANQGQVDARVAYYAPTFAGTLFVTQQGEIVYAFSGPRTDAKGNRGRPSTNPGWSLTETLRGGRARPVAQDPSTAGVSSFLGNDPARWRSSLPTWEQVSLGEVWPGVSVTLRARGRSMEKVFTVHPGGMVSRIRVGVAGARTLTVDAEGALVVRTRLGAVTFTAPVAYQERDGARRPVAVAYRQRGVEYGFSVGDYDRRLPLVIDPLLQSTYLGGSGGDVAQALAIHPTTGDVYVAGETTSSNFPGTAGGAQPARAGGFFGDAFVARLPSTLTALTQATYLGGSGDDRAYALAIHPTTGDVYVAGFTESSNFPGTTGGAQPAFGGGQFDAFVARLPSALTSLTRATYLGGSGSDIARSLAIHPTTGDVYVAGESSSFSNFPGTAGGAQPVHGGGSDAFVARFPSTLTALTQATYLGGSGVDPAYALAIHPATGDVYVAGFTESSNFPDTAGGAQPAMGGGQFDAFVARLPSTLTSLTQATYLGGSGTDEAFALAIHPTTGDVYVAGDTNSSPFPGTAGGAQAVAGGGFNDAFVARFHSTLTSLTQATYLGGSGEDQAYALAIHATTGDVYVAGITGSSNFPGTAGGAQPAFGGGIFSDAFVARLPSTLTSLTQATYLGGSGDDQALALAIHPTTGDIYVAGQTTSSNFPRTAGGAQPATGGNVDAFVARLTSNLAGVNAANPAATVTSMSGSVQVQFQGSVLTVTPGFALLQSMRLVTGGDGRVGGACDDGSSFAVEPNSNVFLNDSLCHPADSGFLDVTRGAFRLTRSAAAVPDGRQAAVGEVNSVVRTPVSDGKGTPGAEFSTTYTQAGNTGSAVTTVSRGSVSVTDAKTGTVTNLNPGQSVTTTGPLPLLAASILPSSRSVQVSKAATAFATIANVPGSPRALACGVAPLTGLPATFDFQITNPNTNQLAGSKGTPIGIPPGTSQSFVFGLTPTGPIAPTDVRFSFACGDTAVTPIIGVNTLLLTASATPVPDIVALAATLNNDGIANIPGATGTGVFAVATVNLGLGGAITASVDTASTPLPVVLSMCQTNPTTGACLAPPAGNVTTTIAANATPTFGIFVTGTGPVPFDPAQNRIFVRFRDTAGSVTRGSTSVAVRTQ